MSDTVPTDSVLRRHYEAARKAAQGENPETRAPAEKPEIQEPAQDSGGFVGWLKKVFCG